MTSDEKLHLEVVVGGVPHQVTVNRNELVEHLVKTALREAHQSDQNPNDWVLRTVDGQEVNQNLRIKEIPAVADGMKLFLSRVTGGGG